MAPIDRTSEKTGEYIKNSIISYLWEEPYCTLRWIRRQIKESGVRKTELKRIFRDLVRDYGNHKRFRTLFDICRAADFDCRHVV